MRIVRYALSTGTHVMRDEGPFERLEGSPFAGVRRTGHLDDADAAALLCPVEQPRIFGVAYNYRAHTDETGKEQPSLPVLFMKPSTSAIGHEEAIIFPDGGEIVHYEGELAAVIGVEIPRIGILRNPVRAEGARL